MMSPAGDKPEVVHDPEICGILFDGSCAACRKAWCESLEIGRHIGIAKWAANRFMKRHFLFDSSVDEQNIIGEAMVGLLKCAAKFRPAKGKFSTFASRMVQHHLFRVFVQFGQGKTRRPSRPVISLNVESDDLKGSLIDTIADPRKVDYHDDWMDIGPCIAALTKRQREAVYLRFVKGLTHDEMSDVMGITSDGAKNLIQRSIEIVYARYWKSQRGSRPLPPGTPRTVAEACAITSVSHGRHLNNGKLADAGKEASRG